MAKRRAARLPNAAAKSKRRKPRRAPPEAAEVAIGRAELVETRARLLASWRTGCDRDIALAQARDEYHRVTGTDPATGGPLPPMVAHLLPPGARVQFDPGPVPVVPAPSSRIEAARLSGELREAGYNPHGIIEPVEQRWVRHAAEVLDDAGVAEALARADLLCSRSATERRDAERRIKVLTSNKPEDKHERNRALHAAKTLRQRADR